jgi:hypothetical protein
MPGPTQPRRREGQPGFSPGPTTVEDTRGSLWGRVPPRAQ